jgi:hypothetical protein
MLERDFHCVIEQSKSLLLKYLNPECRKRGTMKNNSTYNVKISYKFEFLENLDENVDIHRA